MRAPAPLLFLVGALAAPQLSAQVDGAESDLSDQVVVRRTSYGVPHILAETLEAAGFALGYVQLEDYGDRVPLGLIRARGEWALHMGLDSIDDDFLNRWVHRVAERGWPSLPQDARDVYVGFAAGVNRYITLHPHEFPTFVRPDFHGVDVLAGDVSDGGWSSADRIARMLERSGSGSGSGARADPNSDAGSNAWALAPSRTVSGHAILLRNPHLSWDAGYYEAHVTVPGVLNFYGDFRIGGPFGVIGGFNDRLGWATTNNDPDTDELYALAVDPARPDHYLLDGEPIAIERIPTTVEFRNGPGIGLETRELLMTEIGPVVHRAHGRVYVLRQAGLGDVRLGEQFLRMMQADDLEGWQAAMRVRAKTSSNFTYADADGNIFYVWNGSVPALPLPSGGDTLAIDVAGLADVWSGLVPWDSLPMLLNPPGGYLHNENDSFHFTNLEARLWADSFPAHFPEPRLRLRSQHSLELIRDTPPLSLEDVVALKHSMRMELADRVLADLIAAARAAGEASAAEILAGWDGTAARASRGSVLFALWWDRYEDLADERGTAAFEEPWTAARPVETPRGLGDAASAVEALAWAEAEAERRYGEADVAWGEVHRVREGDVDVPVGGCGGELGCFRVLWFEREEDGRLAVRGGDGWVLAVEFGDPPRAYSILGYGQSEKPGSPHDDDQAALFADNRMKPVAFTEAAIRADLERSYRPGLEVETAGSHR
ncbi:MAG: penicillin acylase family protein [Longimicrobiales bacterium]